MQVANLASGLIPYIAGAAVAAFAVNYYAQSLGTGLNPSVRINFQSETVQPMNIVDLSHKGDRLSGGQQSYGQAASSSVASGNLENMELVPKAPPLSDAPRSPSVLPNLPDGCESAFSPLSAVDLKTVAARCVT